MGDEQLCPTLDMFVAKRELQGLNDAKIERISILRLKQYPTPTPLRGLTAAWGSLC